MERIRDVLRHGLAGALREASAQDRLAAAWPVVCGQAIARHTRVVGLSGSRLRVVVTASAWLNQMQSMSNRLTRDLARIADVPLSDIHFSIGATSGS